MEQIPPLLIKKLSDKARLPTRGSAFAAGYDIYASKDTVIPSRGKALVDTDISMAIPAGTCKKPQVPSSGEPTVTLPTLMSNGLCSKTAVLRPDPASLRSTSSTPAQVSLMPTTVAR